MIWLWLSAAIMVWTAIYHSYRGEKAVIRPLLDLDAPLMQVPHVHKVVRAAWHMASYFMAAFAFVVVWPGTPTGLIAVAGAVWLIFGLYLLVGWRGKHKGAYMLMAAGVFALIGAAG